MIRNRRWDEHFMKMVYVIASMSKDQNTHIGAVVVGPDNEIRTTGFNSFPRGINDDVHERQQPPEKYFWFAHAERNSIYNATRMGVSLKYCTMYTNGVPCADCAIAIIQSGITEVVVHRQWDDLNSDKWSNSAHRSAMMFAEAGVELVQLNIIINPVITGYRRGEIVNLRA